MRVRRLTAWLGIDHPVAAGEECDMPDDLAAIHIAHGGAEPVGVAPVVTTSVVTADEFKEAVAAELPAAAPVAHERRRRRHEP